MSSKGTKKFNVFNIFREVQKLYGILYILLLAFMVTLGAFYVKDIDELNNVYKSPVLLTSDTAVNKGLPVVKGTMSPPLDVFKLAQPSKDLEIKGKEVYTTNCASCHGDDGQGNGPAGATLNPPPRNFVNPQKWTNGPKTNEMFISVMEGIPNTGMPSFSNLSPEDIFAVVQYVHTFNPALPRGDQADIQKLEDQYHFSEGVKTPNQIPVDLAMKLMIQEYDTLSPAIKNIEEKIKNDNTVGSKIFDKVVTDKVHALTALASNRIWNENIITFVDFINTQPTNKGFKAEVFELSKEEADILYQYLKILFTESRI